MSRTIPTSPTFSAESLCAHADVSRRTLRYYITMGLVDRPLGETRGAYYTQSHLDQLLRVRRLSESGVSLERIAELLVTGGAPIPPRRKRAGEVSVHTHVHLAAGIELSVDPEQARLSPTQLRALIRAVLTSAEQVLGATDHAKATPRTEESHRRHGDST